MYRSVHLQRRKSNLILANSKHTAKDIASVFPFAQGKTKTILLGRDENFEPVSTRNFLDENGWTAPYFLITGTIEPRKNIETLLEAYRLFREKIETKVLLLIVGEKGWKTKRIFQKIENHLYKGDIVLTGFIEKEQLIEVYSKALALVYPSFYEGFGFPVLEAIACGTRVICANNSSLPEVAGSLGYYFDPNKVQELLAHLLMINKKPVTSITEKESLTQQAQNFSWNKYAIAFTEAIEDLYT